MKKYEIVSGNHAGEIMTVEKVTNPKGIVDMIEGKMVLITPGMIIFKSVKTGETVTTGEEKELDKLIERKYLKEVTN